MNVVTFMYPTTPDGCFDFNHYYETHLPLGVGIAKKCLGLDISKMMIQTVLPPSEGGIDHPYYVLCHIPFDSKDEADRFATLFSNAEAAARLSEDWPKYTPASPLAVVSKWTTLNDMDSLRERFAAVLEPEYAAQSR